MKTTVIELSDRSVEVYKLPIGRYPDLLRKLKTIPDQLNSLQGIGNDEVMAALPGIIANSFDELTDILSTACNLTPQEMSELELTDFTALVQAIVETNEVAKVVENLKAIFARTVAR